MRCAWYSTRQAVDVTYGSRVRPIHQKYVPLDMDVFPMDNSGTKKQGVGYTYKGHDGYAPLARFPF